MEQPANVANEALRQLLTRRGWAVQDSGTGITAHKHDWPAQLRVVIEPGGATEPSILGLMIDFRSMPLGGERFRDIFNSEREQLMRGMGSCRVRQMNRSHHWNNGVTDGAFLHGVDGGVSRNTEALLIDRCPEERGEALVERFSIETTRMLETGGAIASLLQRTYNRVVLRNDTPVASLPDEVLGRSADASPVVVGETAYPWRR